jgi:hypothetical protein
MDLAEFVSDYLKIDGVYATPENRTELSKEIAIAYCEANPDLAGLDDAAFLDVAHNSIAPQVAYYLA